MFITSFIQRIVMKASLENIRDVLGVHAKEIKFNKTGLQNGYRLRGFLPRYALEDLSHTFHVYINKQNDVVVITKGRLNVTSRV